MMDYRDLLRLMLWTLWGLALTLVVSAGLWAVLSNAGDNVGGRAARWMTVLVAVLFAIDIAAIVVTVAKREID